jgi:WD40 repeat protein
VNAVCPLAVDGQPMLATASDDGTVRIWDPATSQPHAILEGHQDSVNAVCPVTVDGQPMLATASDDRTVRIWDPATGRPAAAVVTHYQALAMAEAEGLLVIGLETGLLAIELIPHSTSGAPASTANVLGRHVR